MKTLYLLSFAFLVSGLSLAQATNEAPQPGIAGHPDCRGYFGVMWLDGVPQGQTVQATHDGLSPDQLAWWKQEGYRKASALCYVDGIREEQGQLKLSCGGCAQGWQSSFRWILFEHVEENQKRSHPSEQTITAARGAQVGGLSASVRDPNSTLDREVAVVATGAAVYAGGSPLRPPEGNDPQLFYRSVEKDKKATNMAREMMRNDREAFQAAAAFLARKIKK